MKIAYEDLPPLSTPTEYPGFWGLSMKKQFVLGGLVSVMSPENV